MIKWKLLTASGGGGGKYIGEKEFLEPGKDLEFQVPAGVRRIHVCCIGGGSNGGTGGSWEGGGAGGLAWANNVTVEPGEKLKVNVGSATNDTYGTDGVSDIRRGGDVLVRAFGGAKSLGGNIQFGEGISGGGGNGGRGGSGGSQSSGGTLYSVFYGAGGGAGGYLGNGGDANGGAPETGSGGGSAGTRYTRTNGIVSGSIPGGHGGGVGIKGRGADGPAVPVVLERADDGKPGSGGDDSKYGGGGSYGSGAGHGAVRIIWGIKFSYPDNADIEAVE